jgi:hypothetical protein
MAGAWTDGAKVPGLGLDRFLGSGEHQLTTVQQEADRRVNRDLSAPLRVAVAAGMGSASGAVIYLALFAEDGILTTWTPGRLFSEFFLVAVVIGWLAFMVLDPLLERRRGGRRHGEPERGSVVLLGRPASLLGAAIAAAILKQLLHHGLTHGEGLGWLEGMSAFVVIAATTYAWFYAARRSWLRPSVAGGIAAAVAAATVASGSLMLEMPSHAAGLHAVEGALQWTLCGFVVGRSLDRGNWSYLWLRVIFMTAIIALAVEGAASLVLGFEWLQYFRPLLMALGWGAALLLYPSGNSIRSAAPPATQDHTLPSSSNSDGAAS